jgi:tetratricopeptide (TPR) repeat protein
MDLVEIEFGGEIVSNNLQIVDADVDRSDRQEDLESRQARQLEFLLTVLRSIHESDSNPDIIYPLLRQHLDLLDIGIIEVLRNWTTAKFAEIDRDKQRSIAIDIGNFGNLIQQFPLGNKAVNMELSIECYAQALKVITISEDPENWGTSQNNLAVAYNNRIRGDRAENLEQSIECYRAALEVYTQADLPLAWADTQNNLAVAYNNRIRGDRAENLEQSIECYRAALEVYTQADLPLAWAMTQNNLANAYSKRIRGDRAEDLEWSIECYLAALEVYTQADLPLDWAMTQNNLANAYSNRIRGDRAENLEWSIECYRAALEVRTQADLPLDWAMTQNNLANAYSNRIRGDWAENLELSIEYYREALEVYTAESFPREWANIQVGLARFSIEQLQNYQFATEHLQSAYTQLSANNNDTGLLAETMFELARCFHKTGCLGQAKIYFKDSIRLYQRLEQHTQVAAVTAALGNLELQMGQIDDARIHLQTALEFYQAAGNLERVASIQELQQCLPEYSPALAV